MRFQQGQGGPGQALQGLCGSLESEQAVVMDVSRFKDYIRAREALAGQDLDAALRHLARSLDTPESSRVIQENLERLLDINSLAGEVALQLAASNGRRKESHA
jgi:hypothetical protein